MACGQRSANGHPAGRSIRAGGALDGAELLAAYRVQPGEAVQQSPRIGVAGPREDLADRCLLDDLSRVHHRHAVGHFGDDPEIVRHENGGHPILALQGAEQVEDLGLNRHVERRRGLVGDQQFGIAGQGCGDDGALPQPSAQLEGELPRPHLRLRYLYLGQQANGEPPRLRP